MKGSSYKKNIKFYSLSKNYFKKYKFKRTIVIITLIKVETICRKFSKSNTTLFKDSI